MTREEAERELMTARLGWSPEQITLWTRAHGKCEYCGTNLLANAAVAFHGYNKDHILPDGGDDLENLALACVPCNRIKRRRTFEEADRTLNRAGRIERARNHIREISERDTLRLQRSIELLKICGLENTEPSPRKTS